MAEDKKPALSERGRDCIELKGNLFFNADNATGDMEYGDGLIETSSLPTQLLRNSNELDV